MIKIKLLFPVLVILLAISGCMKVPHEEVPDDRIGSKPIDTDVPANFDWKATNDVTVNIKINDKYEGQYKYSVVLYLGNPLTDINAESVKGVKTNSTATITLTIPSGIKTLYACQTDPLLRKSVRAIEVTGTNLSVDFSPSSTTATTPKVKGVSFFTGARAGVKSVAATPVDATVISGSKAVTFVAGMSYVIKSGDTFSGSITYPESGKCNFFIEGIWDFDKKDDIDVKRTTITVQVGGVITTKKGGDKDDLNISTDASLEIAEGATLTLDFDLEANSTLINYGTLNIEDLDIEGGRIVNNNLMIVGSIEAEGNTSVIDNNATITINNPKTCKLENITINNNCLIQVNPDQSNTNIFFDGVTLNNGAGSLFVCEGLSLKGNKCTIKLAENSILDVTKQLHLNKDSHEISGVSPDKSLARIAQFIVTGNSHVTYDKITVECSKHSNDGYTMTNGAVMTSESDVLIPKNDCSGAENIPDEGGTPEEPEEVPNTACYTYVFEDNWPNMGDYDMNDAVIQLNGYVASVENKTLTFNFRLLATGAVFNIGAGVQLDGNLLGDVKSTKLNDQSVTDPEGGNVHPVVMLFDNAHKMLGLLDSKRKPINTSTIDFLPKDLTLVITFHNESAVNAFKISDLNLFIVTGTQNEDNIRREIHMRGYSPTEKMVEGLFDTGQDASIKGGVYYKSLENFVWGIMIPSKFEYPREACNISTAYEEFIKWVESNGITNELWYKTPTAGKTIKME